MHEKKISWEVATPNYTVHKNIRASKSFKCIFLLSFCVIFIKHAYKNNILRNHEK